MTKKPQNKFEEPEDEEDDEGEEQEDEFQLSNAQISSVLEPLRKEGYLFSGKGISQLYKEIKTMDINKVIL
jgi:hypothetical protein